MAKKVGKKFAWVIKDFSSLPSKKRIYSVPVLIGDYKWRLYATKGDPVDDYFSIFLELVDYESLPAGWGRYVNFLLTVVPQIPEEYPVREEAHCWFSKVYSNWGFPSMILLTKLHKKDAGFLVNGDIHIVAEVDVLEVIDTFDALEKSKESNIPLKKTNDNYVMSDVPLKEASSIKENMVVNGFQVLPSQVESVKVIFERHPEIAVNLCEKNQHLRTTCIQFLHTVLAQLNRDAVQATSGAIL